jgi:hypothetical protein
LFNLGSTICHRLTKLTEGVSHDLHVLPVVVHVEVALDEDLERGV